MWRVFSLLVALIAVGLGEPSLDPNDPVSIQLYRNGSVRLANIDSLPDSEEMQRQRILQRERLKQQRLLGIQMQILHYTNRKEEIPINISSTLLDPETARQLIASMQQSPNVEGRSIGDNTGSKVITDSESYVQKMQSYYPSCGTPNLTGVNEWKDSEEMKMRFYFNVTIPQSRDSKTHVTVMWAKLLLYMHHGPKCGQSATGETTSYLELMRQCHFERVTISLYQYLRPPQPNMAERRRLVDRYTLPASYRGSIEFNMQSVIYQWQHMPERNYGLLVEMENTYGDSLPPALYLQSMNCSDTQPALPNAQNSQHPSKWNNRPNYPTLDLMIMETVREAPFPPSVNSYSPIATLFTQPLTSKLFQGYYDSYQ